MEVKMKRRGEKMKRIGEIKEIKQLAKIKDPGKVFELANRILPHNSPLRKGNRIHIKFLIHLTEKFFKS